MKRMAIFFLLMRAGAAVFAQTGTIDTAVAALKSRVESALPSGARILVVFNGPAKAAADYAAEELSARLANGGRLRVVERSAAVLSALNAESGYQLSGEVDDDSIQDIGHKTGAEYLITGSFGGGGDSYRLVVKATSVRSGELAGQWNTAFQSSPTLAALLANANPTRDKPRWINGPATAGEKYGARGWYYDVGVSNKAASEQLARTRARQNVQQMVAENIASEMRGRIDITSLSVFQSSSVEEAEYRVEAALTNSIKTLVPRYETLEWHIETGKHEGKDYYLAYVLARFARGDIISMVEKVDPPRIADTLFRQLNIPSTDMDRKSELVRDLEAARDYALQGILVDSN